MFELRLVSVSFRRGSTVDPSKYRNVEGSAGCGRELSLPEAFSLSVCAAEVGAV